MRTASLTARTLVGGAILLALISVLIFVRAGGGYQVSLDFRDAGQLVPGGSVLVGGVKAGSIKEIRLTDNGLARITIAVNDEYSPLRIGTEAVVRQKALSGVASRYISLMPGPLSAREIVDGGHISLVDTTSIVDFESLLETLDPRTRAGLKKVIAGSARLWKGKERAANRGIGELAPALAQTQALMQDLTADEPALERFLVQGARFVGSLDSQRDELAALVANSNATLGAIASEDRAFSEALGQFAPTARRANSTFVNLRATLDDLDPLVADAKPAARKLPKLLDELQPLVRDARPAIADLRKTIRRAGKNNDLIDLLNGMPALRDAAVPAFGSAGSALMNSQEVIAFARPYTADIVLGLIEAFGGNMAVSYDANGRFARVAPIESGSSFASVPISTSPVTGWLPALVDGQVPVVYGATQRCPGASTQSSGDGSNPFTDGGTVDCNPNHTPPGPGGQ